MALLVSFAWAWLVISGCIYSQAVQLQHGSEDADLDGDPFSAYDGRSLVKLVACNASAVAAISSVLDQSSCHVLSEPGRLVLPQASGCAQGFAVCPNHANALLLTRYEADILADGTAGQFLRQRSSRAVRQWPKGALNVRRGKQEFYGEFRTYQDIMGKLQSLVSLSNGTAELVELAPKTHEGRAIQAVRLRGSGWRPGSPRAVFNYLLHAREWITAMAGVYALEKTIARAREDPSTLNNTEVVFVPVSNPDGFVYSGRAARFWRKNRRPEQEPGCEGVDLNRNFGFQWSAATDTPCGEVYSGPEMSSEPETKALQDLVSEAPTAVLLDFHSCGGYILGSWSYTHADHPRTGEIRVLGNLLQSAIQRQHGLKFEFCTGNKCLYPVPGNLADFTASHGGLGFTIEMRPQRYYQDVDMQDFAPDPNEIIQAAEEGYAAVQAALSWARGHRHAKW
mmetsp:Transcript_102495/g.330713  ORF Transcript_102495/g.330713 Transcript_102495/m.330713 type:complete len:452 (+) Transcript_102495:94-1449(+)